MVAHDVMTDQELNTMLDVVEKHNQLCIICQYFIECNGLTQGPNGPLYPPCADRGSAFDSGFFDEDDIIEIYEDIIEGERNEEIY